MKKLISVAVILLSSTSLFASEPAEQAPFHLSRFQDNWFASLGLGVNTIIDNGYWGVPMMALDANIGKWVSPHLGVRIGYQGFADKATDTSAGWFAGNDIFGFHYSHFDVMLNCFKHESRFAGGIYLHAGAINTVWNNTVNTEVGIGTGLWAQFRLVDQFSVVADIRPVFARERAWRQAGKLICFPIATVGVSYAFGFGKTGKVGFERHTKEVEYQYIKVATECNHEAQIKALQAKVEALQDSLATASSPKAPQLIGRFTVYFDLNHSELKEKELYHLIDLVKVMPEGSLLNIIGHADKETGTKKRNRVLSEERVDTVFEALNKLGFKGTISRDSKGDEANPFDRAPKNRCVTIKITTK